MGLLPVEAECLVCLVGGRQEEQERVKAPFVLLWVGFFHSLSPEMPVLGLCWILGVTGSAPPAVWSMIKGNQGARGFGVLGAENCVEANLGMETGSTLN